MEWWLMLALFFSGFLLLILVGLPVAFSFLFINIVGMFFVMGGEMGLRQLVYSINESVSRWTYIAIPLFILMGTVMFHSGVAVNMLDALDKWLGRLPGRLSLLAVGGGTLFGAMSGSAFASCALLGSLLVPDMTKRGYKPSMSTGPIMGSSLLAYMIPPSILAVILAGMAEISVGKILIGGIIPGLLMSGFFASYIIVRCWLQPSLAPPYKAARIPLSEKVIDTVRYVLPLGFVIFAVLGLIFLGLATPTESAAVGALTCFIITACYRKLSWEVVKKSLTGCLNITVMTFMIICGSTAFSQILGFSGATRGLVEFAITRPLSPFQLVIVMQVVLLVLGCFIDQPSMIMITVPIYIPILTALGVDLIWFGIIMLLSITLGMMTPPFGMTLFIMKGVVPPEITAADIVRAAVPFLIIGVVVMILMLAFPTMVLWLPGVMRQ